MKFKEQMLSDFSHGQQRFALRESPDGAVLKESRDSEIIIMF